MTIPGNSRTSASSEPRRARLKRRAWLAALVLYGVATIADMAVHLNADRHAGEDWRAPDNLAVAFAAGLFWPLDLVARALLAR